VTQIDLTTTAQRTSALQKLKLPASTTGFIPIKSPQAVTGVTAVAGSAQSFTLATYVVPGGNPADFGAVINWGDSTKDDTGHTIPFTSYVEPPSVAANGSFVVTANHTYKSGGAYSVQVLIVDKAHSFNVNATNYAAILAAFNAGNFAALVDPALGYAINAARTVTPVVVSGGPLTAPDPTPVFWLAVQGVQATVAKPGAFSGTVASFMAPPGSRAADFKATIIWSDHSVTKGRVKQAADGSFVVIGTHRFLRRGIYSAQVTVARKHMSSGDRATIRVM
jgi:hypothetical protein